MLYLNAAPFQPPLPQPKHLTLTSVVFEFLYLQKDDISIIDLTLTSVVFELFSSAKLIRYSAYLTLTSVVFEYKWGEKDE